jgi:chemotaxis protein CheD
VPSKIVSIILMPGEHFAGDQRHRIRTLLGSCVSIILWHSGLRVGAMSHFVLAGSDPRGKTMALNGRYGEDALALMTEDLRALGVVATACQAKVFGGGAMFEPGTRASLPDVGRKNGEAAKKLLHAQRIPIVSESLFDAGHRNITFNVKTGEVWMRHAKPGATAVLQPETLS